MSRCDPLNLYPPSLWRAWDPLFQLKRIESLLRPFSQRAGSSLGGNIGMLKSCKKRRENPEKSLGT
jgi:hypothetical protein